MILCLWQIDEECILSKASSQTSSEISVPKSPSHLFFNEVSGSKLNEFNKEYIDPITPLEYGLNCRMESKSELGGCDGKVVIDDATKLRSCKNLKK